MFDKISLNPGMYGDPDYEGWRYKLDSRILKGLQDGSLTMFASYGDATIRMLDPDARAIRVAHAMQPFLAWYAFPSDYTVLDVQAFFALESQDEATLDDVGAYWLGDTARCEVGCGKILLELFKAL